MFPACAQEQSIQHETQCYGECQNKWMATIPATGHNVTNLQLIHTTYPISCKIVNMYMSIKLCNKNKDAVLQKSIPALHFKVLSSATSTNKYMRIQSFIHQCARQSVRLFIQPSSHFYIREIFQKHNNYIITSKESFCTREKGKEKGKHIKEKP